MSFLSEKKKKWVIQRNKKFHGIIVGKDTSRIRPADDYYRLALDKETEKFIESLYKDLEHVYSSLSVNNASKTRKKSPSKVISVLKTYKTAKLKVFLSNGEKIVKKWLNKARRLTDRSIKEVLYEMAGQKIAVNYDKSYDESLKLMIERNVQLITNATSQTLTNIENIVFDSMTTGEGWKGIQDTLKNQKEISRKRIKLIARDQTAKTNQALSELTQREVGVKFFMWRTAQDERVSKGYGGHKQLNNKIYKWGDTDDYPIIDSYGNRGLPSQRPNCRCIAKPVWILDGYEPKRLPDGSYEIVKESK